MGKEFFFIFLLQLNWTCSFEKSTYMKKYGGNHETISNDLETIIFEGIVSHNFEMDKSEDLQDRMSPNCCHLKWCSSIVPMR